MVGRQKTWICWHSMLLVKTSSTAGQRWNLQWKLVELGVENVSGRGLE